MKVRNGKVISDANPQREESHPVSENQAQVKRVTEQTAEIRSWASSQSAGAWQNYF